MNDTAGAKSFNLKWFGTLTPKQILWLAVAFAAALALTLFGFGPSCMCFGILIIAVILYMLPKMFGVDNIKLMALVGILFMASAVLIGGLVTAPGLVHGNEDAPPDNDYFENIVYEYTENGVDVSATLTGDATTYTDFRFIYKEVSGVSFGFSIGGSTYVEAEDHYVVLTVNGNNVSGSVPLESGSLFVGQMVIKNSDENNVEGSGTRLTYLTEAYDGSVTSLCLYGCLIGVLYIMIVYFMIMIFSTLMRGRMEKAREKMEKEGRLYPPGYGRCAECGSVVLPGEVNCRKCGAYIDRPEEMKPNKKDFFECSDCGAEVQRDAKECPKCGAVFDEEEFEVTHADGTIEVTREAFVCPECGADVPAASSFCVRCGAKFKDDKK